MRNIPKLIEEYLSKSTDYAIQIVGNWGFGKTFFYRNTLEELISIKPIHNDETKKYKPIYISLFGLKSIDDIATKIVFEFYESKLFNSYSKERIKKKRLKITQSVLKIGLRGFLNFKRLGNINDYITDIKEIGENVLDTNELLICFDDLERKDSSLKIEDLTGYINSLVDEGIKVLIITNEDLLLKNEVEYRSLKEKIIGITVEFIPDVKQTLESIVQTRYSGSLVYLEYLNKNFHSFIQLSDGASKNFRHVIYALDCVHNCFSIIKNEILDTQHEVSKILEQELENIFKVTFALAIEYKSSLLKYSEFSTYSSDQLFMSRMLNSMHVINGKDKEAPKSTFEIFIEKYSIDKNNYYVFRSIYNYLTAFDEFKIDDFLTEFIKKFNLEKGKILPQYELIDSLSYQVCYDLSDEDYKSKTLKMIEYAVNGQFAPATYLGVMHYIERFDNFLDIDLNKIKNSLVVGLEKSIKMNGEDANGGFVEFEINQYSDRRSELCQQLFLEGCNLINAYRQGKSEEKNQKNIDLLLTNTEEFIRKYNSDDNLKYSFDSMPFFKYLTPEKLSTYLQKAEANTLRFLKQFFIEKYNSQEKLNEDLNNIEQFISVLTNLFQQNNFMVNYKLRLVLVKDLTKSLNEIKSGTN